MKFIYKTAGIIVDKAGNPFPDLVDDAVQAAKPVAKGILPMLKRFFTNPAGPILLKHMAVIAGATIAANFVNKVAEYVNKQTNLRMEPRYFKAMLEKHPSLADRDPEVVANLWSSLYHHSPHYAQDPIGAGAFIRQMMDRGNLDQFGGPAPDTYKTLGEIQDKATPKGEKTMGPDIIKHLAKVYYGNYLDETGESAANRLFYASGEVGRKAYTEKVLAPMAEVNTFQDFK